MAKFVWILGVFVGLASCKKSDRIPCDSNPEHVSTYLHISHTRTDVNPDIVPEALTIDYSAYEMVMHGGDVSFYTALDSSTITYSDTIFNFSGDSTLLALGNHEYQDTALLVSMIGKSRYYSKHHDGITFLILDTQDSLSSFVGAQKNLIQRVTDTISASSHLVVLTHKLSWMYGDTVMEPMIDSVTNGGSGGCFHCLNPNNFQSEIYPMLESVQQRGVKVICIGGDIGTFVQYFEYTNPDGITYLASGIGEYQALKTALVLEHDKINKELTWRYSELGDLTQIP